MISDNPYSAPQTGLIVLPVEPPKPFLHYLQIAWWISTKWILGIFIVFGSLGYFTELYIKSIKSTPAEIWENELRNLTIYGLQLSMLPFQLMILSLLFGLPFGLLRWLRAKRLYREFLSQQAAVPPNTGPSQTAPNPSK